jgi:hypothetical protein
MELVGYRFFFILLSAILIILSLLVPYSNIEAEIYYYDRDSIDLAFLEQSLRLNVIGIVAVVCICIEFAELFSAVSLLLRSVCISPPALVGSPSPLVGFCARSAHVSLHPSLPHGTPAHATLVFTSAVPVPRHWSPFLFSPAASSFPRPWHAVSIVCHMFEVFVLTFYLICGWGVWVFEITCILFNVLPAIATLVVLLSLFWQDVGNWVTQRLV